MSDTDEYTEDTWEDSQNPFEEDDQLPDIPYTPDESLFEAKTEAKL